MKTLLKQIFLLTILLVSLPNWNIAQEKPTPTPQTAATPPVEDDGDVVKISTALIQLDVVVTDKNGKLVTDLKPEDFEVTENGNRQEVTNLTYFSGSKNTAAEGSLTVNTNGASPTVGEVRRTVAIVVDDAGLSAQSITLVKKELVKVISEQVQSNDLVAVIKTSGSVGVLQQFTTDKNKLLSIIESMRFQPLTSVGLSPLSPISISFDEQIAANNAIGGGLTDKGKGTVFEQRNSLESIADLNRNLTVTSGSLGVLNATIRGMRLLPGRKSILYVAEGVNGLIDSPATVTADHLGGTASIFSDVKKLREQLRGITEIANRATIAIYTLDPRGVLPINISASDSVGGGMSERERQSVQESRGVINGGSNDRSLTDRGDSLKVSQQGLKFLSEETSGKSFINTNDLGKSLRETLDSQNGYYILAYQPDSDTFDPDKRRFNQLAVKVKRPGVNVSYRSGFFNVAEESQAKTKATPEEIFLQKIFSPYKSTDINLQMTSIFAADEQVSTVRAFVNIDAKNLKFTDGADGNKTARFDVIAVNFNAEGIPVANVGKTFDVNASPERYQKLLTDGISYNLTFNTRTRGAQNIKISVRDLNTMKIGTVSQTVEIPTFDKTSIALSGILLQNFTVQEWQNVTGGKAPSDAASRMQSDTARRKFKKGSVLSFNYAVYSAPSFRSKPQAQFTVYKDGKEVFKGAAEDINITPNGKMSRVSKGGAFLLGNEMAAGKYVLQVSVSGEGLKMPETQQIDFELMN